MLVSSFIEKTTSMTFTLIRIIFFVYHPWSFWIKRKLTLKCTTSQGSGQNLLCHCLETRSEAIFQTVSEYRHLIMSWTVTWTCLLNIAPPLFEGWIEDQLYPSHWVLPQDLHRWRKVYQNCMSSLSSKNKNSKLAVGSQMLELPQALHELAVVYPPAHSFSIESSWLHG